MIEAAVIHWLSVSPCKQGLARSVIGFFCRLSLLHDTEIEIPALVYLAVDYPNTNKTYSFQSSEHIHEKGAGPYRGFGYLSLFSDPIDLASWSER